MSTLTRKLGNRRLTHSILLATFVLAGLGAPDRAHAGLYTVVACDSAAAFGYSTAAWMAFGVPDRAYATCPSNGGFIAGLSNRLTGVTYPAFTASGHAFTAPPGARITHLRWAGRIARDSCDWGAFMRAIPSGSSIVGLPNAQFCSSMAFDTRSSPLTFAAPAGTTEIQQLVICGANQCAPGATMHSNVLEVTVDDPVPPSISLEGPLVSGGWVSGQAGASITARANDNAGVQSIAVTSNGRTHAQTYACNWSQPRPCAQDATSTSIPAIGDLADGDHIVRASASDAAGNTTASSATMHVDNTPPDPVVPRVSGGEIWRRTNGFAVSWTNLPNSFAPIIRAHWKICSIDGHCPWRGHRDAPDVSELPLLTVPAPGDYRLHVWLEDAAGNQREANAALAAPLRFDPEPPQLAFLPADAGDPLRVVVDALDRHSGLAGGEIEMRAVGTTTWHGLATQRDGSTLVAYVDDERFRNGAYEFRARAVDHAGNEASTGRRNDGSAATLRLPARIDTRLLVGLPRVVIRRTLVRRHGRRKVVRRRIRRLDSHVVAGHARTLRLHGFLSNADAQPIEGATIEALERRADGGVLPVGFATTDSDGNFSYRLKATRNRTLLFRYGGSRRIGSASKDFTVLVRGDSSMVADRPRVLNGQQVVFEGRVVTRPLPDAGKLVEMQAHFRGRWRTFSTVRTGGDGYWRFPYRFGATVGRVIYRFRARLPAEGGYPFIDGYSDVVKVTVLGP